MIIQTDSGKPVHYSPKASLAVTTDASISSSTEVTLNSNTKVVKVYAIAKDVLLRWGTSDASTSAFDEVVIAGQQSSFAVPGGITALNVIERESGATAIIIEQ